MTEPDRRRHRVRGLVAHLTWWLHRGMDQEGPTGVRPGNSMDEEEVMKRSRMRGRTTPLTSSTELRRTPMPPRQTPLERGTRPLRSSGPTKARRVTVTADERTARRLVRTRSGGWCELRLPGCTTAATDWSHRIARGRGGLWTASNGLAACRSCHTLITNTNGRRAEYERLGFVVRTGADTETVPVWRAEMWVRLLDSGDFVQIPAECTKTRYHTNAAAERALSRIWQHPWHGTGVMPSRSYRCPECHGFHLTSMPLDEYQRISDEEAS